MAVQKEIGVFNTQRLRIGLRQVEVLELSVDDFDVLLCFQEMHKRATLVLIDRFVVCRSRIDYKACHIELRVAQTCHFQVRIGQDQTRKRGRELEKRTPRQRRVNLRQR